MSVGLVIALSVTASLVLGAFIAITVEVARRRTRGTAGTAPAADNAERLRATLAREVELTRRAVTRAAAQWASAGGLQKVMDEIVGHAQRLDQLLATGPTMSPELREQHRKLTTVCATIRTDLADAEAQRSSAALDDTLFRAQIEVGTLRAE